MKGLGGHIFAEGVELVTELCFIRVCLLNSCMCCALEFYILRF